jgi:hypothetical protein
VQNAALAVRSLAAEGQAGALPIEVGPPVDQFQGAGRPLLHQDPDRSFVTEAITGIQGVAKMERNLVIIRQCRRDPSLRLIGGRIGCRILGEHGDPSTAPGDLQRRPQAGDAAADDQSVVPEDRHGPHSVPFLTVCRSAPIIQAIRGRSPQHPMQEIPQHGSTAETFLPRLVARLHRSGFEGVVKISLGIAVRAIYFRGGEIASAASNDEQDRLQSLLLKEGRLTTPQVEMARSRQKPGVSLGKTLIEMGFLTPSELLECARRQVRQILATCFEQSEGEFHLEPGPLPPEVTILGLPTRRLIFDALMEVGDRRRVVREMGSMESVYSPTDDLAAGLATLQIDPAIDQVARGIDGVRSMRDLSGATSHDDFTLSKAILALEILGLVDRGDAPRPAADRPSTGRVIPVESAPLTSPAAPPAADLEADDAVEIETTAAGEDAISAADESAPDEESAEPPVIPSDDLPAFAVPPSETTEPPQWSIDPKTGERIHEGPIEMTFDGLVRSKERPQAVSTRLFAVTAVIVALVVLAFFLFAPGSQEESPTIAGIGDHDPAPPAGNEAPPAPPETPQTRRPPATDTPKSAAPATKAPQATPPRTDAAKAAPPPAEQRPEAAVSPPGGQESGSEEKAQAAPPTIAPASPRQETSAPATSVGQSSPFRSTADYAAALAQLDGGQLQGAAQGFQNLVSSERPGGFTLQLMIACQPDTVKRARAQSGDEGMLFVLPYTYKGQGCYRTCWGIYPDKQAAHAAIGHLPRAYSEAGIKPVVVALERLRGTR